MPEDKGRSGQLTFHPFKDLKKVIKKKKPGVPAVPFPPEKTNPVSDSSIFADAMKCVREIREFREIPLVQKRPVSVLRGGNSSSDRQALRELKEIVEGQRPIHLPDTQEYVMWVSKDCRGDIAGDLHKGRYSVQDELDLHGVVIEEAENELKGFIKESVRKGYRCVKVIHGRGLRSQNGPVLKKSVVRWLSGRYRRHVVAFVSARQCDGGLGALYVLLRSNNP
jgi:DNA-nicking Smr family endonuclease